MIERDILNAKILKQNTELNSDELKVLISERKFNTFSGSIILFGSTEKARPLVIKIPKYTGEAEREWIGISRAYNWGISVAEPVALVKLSNKQDAIITDRVYGDKLYTNDHKQLRKDLGFKIFEMHNEVPVDIFDSLEKDSYFQEQIEKWKEIGNSKNPIWTRTNKLLADLYPFVLNQKLSQEVFNHNDLHDGQIIIQPNNKLTILDFGNWKISSNLNDIAYYLFHTIRTRKDIENYNCFLEGYFIGRKIDEDLKKAIGFFTLFISTRALQYFMKYHPRYYNSALRTHDEVMKYIDEEF